MSSMAAPYQRPVPLAAVDARRGSQAMWMFILTEAMLFLMLFFTYYYLGHSAPQWPTELPKLRLALPMLAILLASSGVLYLGEEASKQGRIAAAKAWVGITAAMGVVFLGLQVLEYRDHFRTLLPTTNAYGSIFYTITSFHGAHLVLGLLMLVYVLMLPPPHVGRSEKPPHHGLHNAALYWHFVDTVWVFIVGLLYLAPHFTT